MSQVFFLMIRVLDDDDVIDESIKSGLVFKIATSNQKVAEVVKLYIRQNHMLLP